MRKIFLLLAVVASLSAYAQDVIVKMDGSTILSKVIKIGSSEVEYKKFSNQNGPTYSLLKSDIQAINYENGEKEMFGDATHLAKEEVRQQIIPAMLAADNKEIINRYNIEYEHGEIIKEKEKPANCGWCIMGVGDNSVLSTEDITIEFRQETYTEGFDVLGTPDYNLHNKFFVQIYNKTDNIIYIDLGSTFRVMGDGTSKVYFDTSQTTVNKGNISGASINFGAITGAAGIGGAVGTLANGVAVGGGNTTSISKTYMKQRIVSVPPHGRIPLEKYIIERTKGSKFEIISEGEDFHFDYLKGQNPPVTIGGKYIYKEEDSPYRAFYTISYSKEPDFSSIYNVKASIYLRELIGGAKWPMYFVNREKPVEKIKKNILNYNDYTIVGIFYVK